MTTKTPRTFDIEVTYIWTERNVIPPRCRNPRDITREGTVTVHTPWVTAAEAPVAFVVTDRLNQKTRAYRWYDGRLFLPLEVYSVDQGKYVPAVAGENYKTAQKFGHTAEGTDADAQELVRTRNEVERVVIDGTVWAAAAEPCYKVQTFGLGWNHGGTGLFTDATRAGTVSPGYFGADEFEAARAHAIEVATLRGDTRDVPQFEEAAPEIEVLIPGAVTVRYTPPTYTYSVEFTSTEDERYAGALARAVRDLFRTLPAVQLGDEFGNCALDADPADPAAALNGFDVVTDEKTAATLEALVSTALGGRPVTVTERSRY